MGTIKNFLDRQPAIAGHIAYLAVACVTLGGALYSQYVGGLYPCELCLEQREPWYAGVTISLLVLALPFVLPMMPEWRMRGLIPNMGLLLWGMYKAGDHIGVEQGWWGAGCTAVDTGAGRTEIYRLASEDLEALRAQLDGFDNVAYYMPYYRNTNTSHCLTVTGLEDIGSSELDFLAAFQEDRSAATWIGTEIETASGIVTFKDFIEQVIDEEAPLESHYEGTCEGRPRK